MKLHEIIEANDRQDESILIEELAKYAKSLYIYYKAYFACEPILMVTSVMNAVQYARIEPENEFSEAVFWWVDGIEGLDEEEKQAEIETISFNSIMFTKAFNL